MKKKNLIVLDIDDTLTISGGKHNDALLYGMHHFGIKNIDTDWRNYKHATDTFVFSNNYERQFKKLFDVNLINEFETVMSKRFLKGDITTQLNGASEAIRFIESQTNYGVCFATGSVYKLALMKLKQANIEFNTEVLSSSNNIFSREGIINASIEKAKKKYGVNKFENIISFGDSLWDVKTAKNLGIYFVGVNDKNIADFKKTGVQCHISDWTEFNINQIEIQLNITNEK